MTDLMSASPAIAAPQPLGAFGFPAGLLLVPDGPERSDEVSAACADLVAGRLPRSWPAELRGHALVHADDLDAALPCFAGNGPIDRYNRWVLDPDTDTAAAVRAGLPAALAPLVDVVSHMVGIGPAPCADVIDLAGLPAEVTALLLATSATTALEHGDVATAVDLLTRASRTAGAASPAFAAVLLGSAATLLREHGHHEPAAALLVEAADGLVDTDLGDVRAELLHQRGSLAHELAAGGQGDTKALLHDAMSYYYDGLKLVTEESAPQLWASLQMNLATAHLAVPMSEASDQLRLGVATQALRACRRVYTAAEHPAQWSTATLNLANALIYTPSTHQGDNLVEAVELYESVLESGIRERDPLGRARLLSNQGNALAHLGIFDQARPKLVEARFLFEEHLDHDSAMAVRQLLGEIAKAEVADPDESLADLARQSEQMARMPTGDGAFTAGMGVRLGGVTAGDLTGPPPKPTVTVLPAGSAPRRPATAEEDR